jgi:hypothetical protein
MAIRAPVFLSWQPPFFKSLKGGKMDIFSNINAAISSLKSAKDISQVLLNVKEGIEIQTTVIELQSKILAAQGSAIETQAQLSDLHRELATKESELQHFKSWETEKARYALTEVSPSIFVYAIRSDSRGEEPVHWLCSICFTNDKKSILQLESEVHGVKFYRCHGCKSGIRDSSAEKPPRDFPRSRGGSPWS